jgi:tRNA(Ile)-lysidine synthase
MQLLDRVRQTIRAHDLAGPETRVVVALSGGSDSVALAYLLRDLEAAGELGVAGVAHFNHQLRAAADHDEQFCGAMAARLSWRFFSDSGNVGARARAQRRSIEDAARAARHECFERARLHFDADVVALGHTRDDQAETFLLRLLRGAGARGLGAMHPRHAHIIRPVLDCRRAQLRAFVDSRQIAYVDDESNEDVSIPRNRVRAELLPLIESRFNPSIVDVLADEAAIAREEWRWMDQAARLAGGRVYRRDGEGWRIDADALNSLPTALARTVVRSAMTEAAGEVPVSFRHVEDALRLARLGGAPMDGPGHRMERVDRDVVLTRKAAGASKRAAGAANFFRYPLSIPGEVALAEAGCVVSAETAASIMSAMIATSSTGSTGSTGAGAVLSSHAGDARPAGPVGPVGPVGIVRLDRCPGPLAVRNRRPGDRFRPLGLDGRKKLQDYFVDRKVARQRRDAVPLVVDESDRIVWVAGHSIDAEFRVTDPAQAVLILRLRQV